MLIPERKRVEPRNPPECGRPAIVPATAVKAPPSPTCRFKLVNTCCTCLFKYIYKPIQHMYRFYIFSAEGLTPLLPVFIRHTPGGSVRARECPLQRINR